jgi:hypothetical protein
VDGTESDWKTGTIVAATKRRAPVQHGVTSHVLELPPPRQRTPVCGDDFGMRSVTVAEATGIFRGVDERRPEMAHGDQRRPS